MTYRTILTAWGQSQLTAAETSGLIITLPTMAVGDGSGSATTPDASQTALVNEVYRAAVNRVYRDPDVPALMHVEFVIPGTVSGFVIREIGLFDAAGHLFAVGNVPDTIKPTPTEGAYADTVINLAMQVSNDANVTLTLDPNVVVATQGWVNSSITLAKLAPGGTFHQVLRKRSNIDGDVEWADPTDVNVVVDTIEETQVLSAGQTAVVLATCTTHGLAVYINGSRLRADQWTADVTDVTKFTLGTAATAGAEMTCVQNEPAAHAPNPLTQANNLSDLQNAATARANLGVISAQDAFALFPPGSYLQFFGLTAPSGFLLADGSAVSRTVYAALFNAIGTLYGIGDGFTTFNLPDMRGLFARGLDHGRGYDPLRRMGVFQPDGIAEHAHLFAADDQIRVFGWADGGKAHFNYDARSSTAGGDAAALRTQDDPMFPLAPETRPKNMVVLPCIKT